MALHEKKCTPCAAGTPPMSMEAAERMLQEVPGWEFALDGKAIKRRFAFKDFLSALAFVNKLAPVVEAEGHHPDLLLGWGYVECIFWTHTIVGLHENDFIMASKVSQLA